MQTSGLNGFSLFTTLNRRKRVQNMNNKLQQLSRLLHLTCRILLRSHRMKSSITNSRSLGWAAEPLNTKCGTAAMNRSTFSQRIFTECWVDIIPVFLQVAGKSQHHSGVSSYGCSGDTGRGEPMPGPPSCSEMWGWFRRPVFARVSREGAGPSNPITPQWPCLNARAHTHTLITHTFQWLEGSHSVQEAATTLKDHTVVKNQLAVYFKKHHHYSTM